MNQEAPSTKPVNRQAFIDHIRVFLTVLVIAHHAAVTYGASGNWFCKEVQSSELGEGTNLFFTMLVSVDQSFFMGMFFLIAGYFTPKSLERKGTARFIGERLLRLGLPLVFFLTVLFQLTVAISAPYLGHSFGGVWKWLYQNPSYTPGPLWFVQTLLIFAFLYAIWNKLRRQSAAPEAESPLPRHRTLFLAALGVGLCSFLVRQWMPAGDSVAGMQLGYFPPYILLFFTGCAAARHKWLERIDWRYARPWVFLSLLLAVSLPFIAGSCPDGSAFSGGMNRYALTYALWDPFISWGIMLGLLFAVRRFLNGTNAFVQALARASYATYIIHATVLVATSVALRGWTAAPVMKWAAVSAIAVCASFALSAILVRIPGIKKVI